MLETQMYRANTPYHLNCLLAVSISLLFFYLVLGNNLYLALIPTQYKRDVALQMEANGRTGKSSTTKAQFRRRTFHEQNLIRIKRPTQII